MTDEAKKRALRLLDRRDMSKKELIGKLLEKGENPEDARNAADRLEELGFLNDARYAGLVVRHYAAKGYGRRRVQEELYRRGLPRELWDEALSGLPEPDESLDRMLRARLRGASPDDRAARKRACDALVRRGFSWEDISAALERLTCERQD
jgi:regulatory protein